MKALKATNPDEEWRIGIMLKSVKTRSGNGHIPGDVVLLHPCNNVNWDNLMVVRPKPTDEVRVADAGISGTAYGLYENMVIGVHGSAVIQVDGVAALNLSDADGQEG